MAPELVFGLTLTDSYRFNLTWAEQFGELFRHGQAYPRWLPLSWDGLGSPNFYFYPPLFFWVAAAVDTVTGGMLSSERFVPFASLIALGASGLTMRAWLRMHAGEGHALLGSVAYMAAPYHLYDIYGRGALAEATAYASVPLVMLALARLSEGRVRYLPLVSCGYAALLYSHLPSALLVSLFLIPPYVAFLAGKTARPSGFVACALVGGLLGIALAAIYLLPALTLLNYVSPAALSGSFYRPESWFFWNFYSGPIGARMLLIIPISIAAFLIAAAMLFGLRTERLRSEATFWGALTIMLVMLIAGLIPQLWKLPGLMLVQFPWRALLCVEFTGITMLVICETPPRRALAVSGAAVLAFAYAVLAMFVSYTVGRTPGGQQEAAADIRAHYPDAPEYLPAGTRIDLGAGPSDVRFALPRISAASASVSAAKLVPKEAPDGSMRIDVDTPTPTGISLARFYFPHWRLVDANGRRVRIDPDPATRVVTFQAPAGRSMFRLELAAAPYEIAARAVSLIALLALALVAACTSKAQFRMSPATADATAAAIAPLADRRIFTGQHGGRDRD